jgi:hypothetical protein
MLKAICSNVTLNIVVWIAAACVISSLWFSALCAAQVLRLILSENRGARA